MTSDEGRLEVRDDGRGFEAGHAQDGPGLGLISMRERLRLVNGDVVIESAAGRGTAVRATVSLAAAAGTDQPEARASNVSV